MNLFKKQSDAQRFLLRMVPKGFHWWTSGIATDKAKLDKLSEKYAEHYGTELKPWERSYRKKKGLANAHFVAASLPISECEGGYIWFLVANDGRGMIRENSKLKDARTNAGRITWNDYVMYEAPRHRLEGGGTRWSWYLKVEVQKKIDHHVGQLLKTAPHELSGFLAAQLKRPLHHGIRHWLSRLIKRAHQNFKRMHPDEEWRGWEPVNPLPAFGQYQSDDE